MSKINTLSGNCKSFAEACYDLNSIQELESAIMVDSTDTLNWEISKAEWHQAVSAAKSDLISDSGE